MSVTTIGVLIMPLELSPTRALSLFHHKGLHCISKRAPLRLGNLTAFLQCSYGSAVEPTRLHDAKRNGKCVFYCSLSQRKTYNFARIFLRRTEYWVISPALDTRLLAALYLTSVTIHPSTAHHGTVTGTDFGTGTPGRLSTAITGNQHTKVNPENLACLWNIGIVESAKRT